jgi:hypothetical protein
VNFSAWKKAVTWNRIFTDELKKHFLGLFYKKNTKLKVGTDSRRMDL